MVSGVARLARLLGVAANRPLHSRLRALKVRTLLSALAALSCGFFGIWLIAQPLSRLSTWVYGLVLRQDALPLAHVPVDGFAGLPQATLLLGVFLVVSVLAIIGFSMGVFKRTPARVVMIPPLVVGLVTAYFVPDTSHWLHVLPSKLERDIMHGRFDAAERVLKESGAHAAIKQYVQAQIALRANDSHALRIYGEPVLKLADQFAYGQKAGSGLEPGALQSVVQFHPEVIHALDLALNREPQTQVGIQWQQERATRNVWLSRLMASAQLGLGVALLVAAMKLLTLWNQMRRRVRAIQTESVVIIDPEADPDDELLDQPMAVPSIEQVSLQEMARAEAISASSGLTLEPMTPGNHQPAAIPVKKTAAIVREEVPQFLPVRSRRAGFIAVGMVLVFAAYFGMRSARSPSGQLSHPAVGPHPCAFVGVWTASRDRSVYKVTMKDTGAYTAEPIARGSYSGVTIVGTWSVRGDKIEWTGDEPGTPAHPPDINLVKNASTTGFTLVEVNGSLTQYNRIETINSSTCALQAEP